jgi:hypothetical protein
MEFWGCWLEKGFRLARRSSAVAGFVVGAGGGGGGGGGGGFERGVKGAGM